MNSSSTQQVEETVIRLVAERGGVATLELTRATHFRDDLNFDSLDLVELTMSLEESFGIAIPDSDGETLQTVGHVVDYVIRKTSEADRKADAAA